MRMPNFELTIREYEVLNLLCEGLDYKEIAGRLIISQSTTKTHVNNIFQKLQVNDRTQCVLQAIKEGYVTLDINPTANKEIETRNATMVGKLEKVNRALLIVQDAIKTLISDDLNIHRNDIEALRNA